MELTGVNYKLAGGAVYKAFQYSLNYKLSDVQSVTKHCIETKFSELSNYV